jgi:hypothetical protein
VFFGYRGPRLRLVFPPGFDPCQNDFGGMILYGLGFGAGAQAGGSMSRFVVRFMKDVLGENGREAEVCQGSLEIDASDEGQATELAKRKFCEAQALHHWSLHADRIQVSEADVPS